MNSRFEITPVYWEVLAVPSYVIEGIDIHKSLRALNAAMVDHSGWPFVFLFQNSKCDYKITNSTVYAISQSPFADLHQYYSWEFDYEKGAFYSRNWTKESSFGFGAAFFPKIQIWRTVEAMEAFGRLFEHLGYSFDEGIEIAMRYSPAGGLQTGNFAGDPETFLGTDPFRDDILTTVVTYNLLQLRNRPAECATKVVANLLEKLNYPNRIPTEQIKRIADSHLSGVFEIPFTMRIQLDR